MAKHVGFVSTRFAGTDGVSLESAKWAEVLWEQQHVSSWYGGVLDRASTCSMCIPEAFFHHPDNEWINQQLWGKKHRSPLVSRRIRDLAEYLKVTLYEFIRRFDVDVLVLENALTIPMHVPLGVAITEVLVETEIPAIAHHHDFYWERQRFQVSAAIDYLEKGFPPRIPRLQHVVINEAAREELAWRKGIRSLLIPNVLDFDQPAKMVDDYAADVREQIGLEPNDKFILQPTRIVPRKGIEHSIALVRRLKDPRCKLVVSHRSGDEGADYANQLQVLAHEEGVDLRFFGHRVAEFRQKNAEGEKVYVLEDLYPHADLVTFPSIYEGFGNALLEAVYFRVPPLVNRYDVYVRDIEPKGFQFAHIDGFVGRDAVREVRRILDDAEYRERLVHHNYEVARRHFSYKTLRFGLQMLMDNIGYEVL